MADVDQPGQHSHPQVASIHEGPRYRRGGIGNTELLLRWVLGVIVAGGIVWVCIAGSTQDGVLDGSSSDGSWQHWVAENADVPITIGTFLVALTLGIVGTARAVRESRPLRLCARFDYGESPYLLVEDAPLTGLADVRAWAQQISRSSPVNSEDSADLKLGSFSIDGPWSATIEGQSSKERVRRVFLRYSVTERPKVDAAKLSTSSAGSADQRCIAVFNVHGRSVTYEGATADAVEARWEQLGGPK